MILHPSIDEILQRFEETWKSGRRPDFLASLPKADHPDFRELVLELAFIDLFWRIRSGDHAPLVETYLALIPHRLQKSEVEALIRLEYQQRWRRGELGVRREEYLERFPELREQLKEMLPLWDCPDCNRKPMALPDESVAEVRCPCSPEKPRLVLDLFQSQCFEHLDLRDYDLKNRVGRGAMGEVFQSLDPALERPLAVKILLKRWQGNPEVERRFIREAKLLAALEHPNIVPVHNLGRLPDGRPFYTMKLVRGETLQHALHHKTRSLQELVEIFEQMCQALRFAHENEVIHRDLKPANVMIGESLETQVMDWGLARLMRDNLLGSSEGTRTTKDGDLLGTVMYMPPEQARGEVEVVDKRADVFALGAILCEMLTGAPPYLQDKELIASLLSAEVVGRARGNKIKAQDRLNACEDQGLAKIARRCLAVDPDERPADAGAVVEMITAYREDMRRKAEDQKHQRSRARWLTFLLASSWGLAILGLILSWRFHDLAGEKDQQLQAAVQNVREQRRLVDALNQRRELIAFLPGDELPVGDQTKEDEEPGANRKTQGVVWSSCGRFLASSHKNGKIKLWRSFRGKLFLLQTLPGHKKAVQDLDFNSDGSRLVSASVDGTARVWCTQTGQELFVYRGHGHPVHCARFHPTGLWIASGSCGEKEHGEVHLWDPATGRLLRKLSGGHKHPVTTLTVSSDGKRLLSSETRGRLIIWIPEKGQRLMSLPASRAKAIELIRGDLQIRK